jgi:hypothetical protein
MPRIACRIVAALAVAGSAFVGFAQTAPAPAKTKVPRAPQPFTAEFKITSVQTLANGTTITRESTEVEARDSAGRSLHSAAGQGLGIDRDPISRTNVSDPVGGTQSEWDSRTTKARVYQLPPEEQRGCWSNDGGDFTISRYDGPRPDRPAPSGTVLPGGGVLVPSRRHTPEVEDLGTNTIQGYEVQGKRMTTTIPAGEIGNSEPIVIVNEHWSSPQFPLSLRDINDDPRSGKRTRELVSLTPGEPELSIFQPPQGYEVKEEELHQVTCRQASH